jgi:hypothetical protein
MVGAPAFMRGKSALALREIFSNLIARFSAGNHASEEFALNPKKQQGCPYLNHP